ncbi:uncharacterized protein BO96DRAFT_351711, partial [Aspergillus niger CBS 101883]
PNFYQSLRHLALLLTSVDPLPHLTQFRIQLYNVTDRKSLLFFFTSTFSTLLRSSLYPYTGRSFLPEISRPSHSTCTTISINHMNPSSDRLGCYLFSFHICCCPET